MVNRSCSVPSSMCDRGQRKRDQLTSGTSLTVWPGKIKLVFYIERHWKVHQALAFVLNDAIVFVYQLRSYLLQSLHPTLVVLILPPNLDISQCQVHSMEQVEPKWMSLLWLHNLPLWLFNRWIQSGRQGTFKGSCKLINTKGLSTAKGVRGHVTMYTYCVTINARAGYTKNST